MPGYVSCAICDREVDVHDSFVVRIDVFADPSLPDVSGAELEIIGSAQTMADLLEQMKQMSPDELQDGVHRRFEYRLCGSCQREFLANPLGLPRKRKMGTN